MEHIIGAMDKCGSFGCYIETAKANNLEPYKHLRYLFEKIPFAE
jgi:hypothetical protein